MPVFIGAIISALGLLTKNPIVMKMAFFAVFVSFLLYGVYWLRDLVVPFLVSNYITQIMAYFGLFDALSLYLSILLAGFAFRRISAYITGT